MSKDYVEHAGCRVMNQPTEQNIVALSLTTQAFHGDQIARRICCRPASDSALHGRALAARLTFWEIQLCFEMNSQCLWIKKKKKKKVLDWVPSFWNGNVSHFHEYWIESATACESSLSSAIDIMQTLSCKSSKPFFFFLAWSPINVFPQSEFAQTLYRGALTSVCQKWCQCSHGNYSYTLPHALPQLEWHSALFVCQMSDLISRQVAVNAEGESSIWAAETNVMMRRKGRRGAVQVKLLLCSVFIKKTLTRMVTQDEKDELVERVMMSSPVHSTYVI